MFVDQMLRSMKDRFDKILFALLATFRPSQFSELLKRFKTATNLQRLQPLKQLCDKYNLNYITCADELFSFARVCSRFDSSFLYSEVDQDEEMLDEDEIDGEVDEDSIIDVGEQQTGG